MKRSKFSEAQLALILRQANEGATIGEVCRRAGISEATSGAVTPTGAVRVTSPSRKPPYPAEIKLPPSPMRTPRRRGSDEGWVC